MMRSVQLIVCCILTAGGFAMFQPTQPERSHDEWLQQRYAEATSIKARMTRAQLMKLFRADGGLQLILPTRYVLKSSDMIKVDVEFDVPEGVNSKIMPEDEAEVDRSGSRQLQKEGYRVISDEKLKIKSISKPYLEPFDLD
jgi:hypothetical protein